MAFSYLKDHFSSEMHKTVILKICFQTFTPFIENFTRGHYITLSTRRQAYSEHSRRVFTPVAVDKQINLCYYIFEVHIYTHLAE